MKRFFILVSMVALVAAGCTKTIIKNEVETPISFSTESGKLTRAIVNDANYLEKQANPAEVFDLQKYGKTVGYIKTNIVSKTNNGTGDAVTNYNPFFQYNFDQGDIDIYPATDYVHACLEDNTTRNTEEVPSS